MKHKVNRNLIGITGVAVVAIYFIVGLYAPLFAGSLPLAVVYDHSIYFPLFKTLFYQGSYSKAIDLFFNIGMFTFPLGLALGYFYRLGWVVPLILQLTAFFYLFFFPIKDPASSGVLNKEYYSQISENKHLTFNEQMKYKNDFYRLTQLLNWMKYNRHHERIISELPSSVQPFTPYAIQKEILDKNPAYFKEFLSWYETEKKKVSFILWPFLREFNWEEDAGGDIRMNLYLPWYETTRINHKDLVAALLFGIRISLTVGILSIALSLAIAIPIGAIAGYYAGITDIIVCRLLEVWEGMPTFFMLLLVVAMTQSKSIFLIILIIGFFGWTSFSRFVRGEFFKERKLPYVEAGKVFGFSDSYLMFNHILPNAIAPLITLTPFAILGAITAEAGLSFLGLGEENTPSWGTLMDEGREAFPAQSYLLWPPALLLTVLLVAIALVGDWLRDIRDPRLRT